MIEGSGGGASSSLAQRHEQGKGKGGGLIFLTAVENMTINGNVIAIGGDA